MSTIHCGCDIEAQHLCERHRTEVVDVTQDPWQSIATAPLDRPVVVHAASVEGLPSFQTFCQWHESGGFCVDELRPTTHWRSDT